MQMNSLTAQGVVENPAPSQPSSLANTTSREAKGLSSSACSHPQLWVLWPCSSGQSPNYFRTGDPTQTAVPHTPVHSHPPVPPANCLCCSKGLWSLQPEGGLRTDRWTLLHRPRLQFPRVVTHGKFTDNIFSLNGTIYTVDVYIKWWNASYSCPAQKQVESCFFRTVQSFDTGCYNHKDSSKSLNRKFLLEQ